MAADSTASNQPTAAGPAPTEMANGTISASGTTANPASQIMATSDRNRGSCQISAAPRTMPEPCLVSGPAAAACGPMQYRITAAARTNVAASIISAVETPTVATAMPANARPTSVPTCLVIWRSAWPAWYASPDSTAGSTAACAAMNGACANCMTTTSPNAAASGVAGAAIRATSTACTAAQTTRTLRRG